MDPPAKKLKKGNMILDNIATCIKNLENCTNLKAILSDEYEQQLSLTKMYIGRVIEKKNISKVILTLNERVPLKNFNHLKRVRGKDVILCPSDKLTDETTIQDFLEVNTPELSNLFEYFKEIEVPAVAPKIKKQFNPLLWSMNFHPNKYLEKLTGDNFFEASDMKQHKALMEIVFKATTWFIEKEENIESKCLQDINTTLVFDPSYASIVAIAFYNIKHPIQHSSMLAIDYVARTQNGGAWGKSTQSILSGIDTDLLKFLQQSVLNVRFGAREFISKRDFVESESSVDNIKEGPYLCTGYHVYMLKEPCIMCSMALVHARAKRVFFCFDNKVDGGLKSKTKLQAAPSLNHHFEVFTGFLKDVDIDKA